MISVFETRTLLISLAVGLLLAGCRSSTEKGGPGGNRPNLDRANYECVRDSWTSRGGSGVAGAPAEAQGNAKDVYRTCMRAHGWTLQEVPKATENGKSHP